MSKSVVIYHTINDIELFYTLFPFIVSSSWLKFKFVQFNTIEDIQCQGDVAIFIRIFKKRFDDEEFVNSTIKKLKILYPKVIFLDDSAGADSLHFEFIEKLDLYFKGKLIQDRSTFFDEIYGRQAFSNYFHKEHNVVDSNEEIRVRLSDIHQIDKLKLSYNLGFGIFPKTNNKWHRRFKRLAEKYSVLFLKPYFHYKLHYLKKELQKPIIFNQKKLKVSARFHEGNLPSSIGYQRKILREIVESKPQFLSGLIQFDAYQKEMKEVFATLSPFGYGEVCFRDFEAVINGSLLIKPSMEHLQTYPNIYIPYETYIPIKWDGSDLLEKVDEILLSPKEYFGIIKNSRRVYLSSLNNLDSYISDLYLKMIL